MKTSPKSDTSVMFLLFAQLKLHKQLRSFETANSVCYIAGKLAIIFIYANTPVQYTAIIHSCKNVNFQMRNCDIFLIFAQNIDRGYTLEPPQCGGSNKYPQFMFSSKKKKK